MLIVLCALAIPVSASGIARASADSPSVMANMNGSWVPVSIGSVIGTGFLNSSTGVCTFKAPVEVSLAVGTDLGPSAMGVDLDVDASCRVVVGSIYLETPAPTSGPTDGSDTSVVPSLAKSPQSTAGDLAPTSAVNHKGWTRANMLEYVDITVNKVYVAMNYTRNGGSVYNGSNPVGTDWVDDTAIWQWQVKNYAWWPDGPSNVYILRSTYFHSSVPPRPTYTFHAKFVADPDPHHRCGLDSGAIPAGWELRCEGGLYY